MKLRHRVAITRGPGRRCRNSGPEDRPSVVRNSQQNSQQATRYNGTETVLSSSPFASATWATARPSFNDGVTLTARKPALPFRAVCTAARSETFAFAIAALCLFAAV